MTIVEFLLARIAEDEKRANYFDPVGASVGPARLLAECQAKRAMVEESLRFSRSLWLFRRPPLRRVRREEYERLAGRQQAAAWALRYLAAVYADHPEYREEWRA